MLRRGVSGGAGIEYSRLVPDYTRIGADYDAVSSIDEFSVFAYFASRGYECLNIRRNPVLRLLSPYRDFRRWVIVRKGS
jgi:hypothetical protein